ncbi:MAG: hypothetical protein AUI61_01105 [Thaumarchaeota archaeon 13_1_40CM_2_39_13_2]|nr:MAG: hypothetical protein AUI61_01105 [Thaumarchaeota archaeon 13_1_40CM_2_39_13_2]
MQDSEKAADSFRNEERTRLICDANTIHRALVSIAIERALLGMGRPVYEKVVDRLYNEYHCYLTDCYVHPEYLSQILKDIFGFASWIIIKSINEDLKEFRNKKDSIARFLEIVEKGVTRSFPRNHSTKKLRLYLSPFLRSG